MLSQRSVHRWQDGKRRECTDTVIVEEALELRFSGRSLAVLMRTPGHDLELVRGLLYSEGVIRDDERAVDLVAEGKQCVRLLMDEKLVDKRWARRDSVTSSACGVCGTSSLARLEELAQPILSDLCWSSDKICAAPSALREKQLLFQETGALHGAAIFDHDGKLLQCREDVGRHNAVDKLVGWALGESLLPLSELVLVVSSRLSFEIVHKAICAGIPMIVGISAPSSLAIDLAERWRVTLVGFVRGQRFNVYSHQYRVVA